MSHDRVALVCTRGFADVLTLARQNRVDPYALHVPPSPWLERLPAAWRIEAAGRIDADGREVEPLDAEAVVAALATLPAPPRAVAICLLFAARMPDHERRLAERIAQALPGVPVACSHRIAPDDSEYERSVATLASLGCIAPAGAKTGCDADAGADGRAAVEAGSEVEAGSGTGTAAAGAGASAANAPFAAIADDMQRRLVADAHSSVVREAMDCAAALFLPDGRMIAESDTLPLLLGSLSPAVGGLLAAFDVATMADGDGFLLNDPWHGGTHLPDFVLVRPVVVAGRVRALAACVLHHQDVGGIAPGSVPTDADSIHQEGLRVPPLRLFVRDRVEPALLRLLCANSRMPANLQGDLAAQWACLRQGAEAAAARIADDPDGIDRRCAAALAASEAAVRAALRAAPDGDYEVTDVLDGDGRTADPVPLAVRLRKRGDALTIDLTGCAPQTAGPVNASRGAVRAAIAYFARLLAPGAAGNDGCLAPIRVVTRPGSIVDPLEPAAVNARTNLVKLLANALLAAWGQARPERMPAPNAGEAVVLSLGGERADGRRWLFTEIIASAAGGAPWGPGGSGVSTDVGNARSTPAEVIERQAPIRVERVAIRAGSGGAGRHRGGDGVIRVYRLLEGHATISYRGERHRQVPLGAAGGGPGTVAAARVERAGGGTDHLPAKARVRWQAGDRLVVETAGAGGWGSPEVARPETREP